MHAYTITVFSHRRNLERENFYGHPWRLSLQNLGTLTPLPTTHLVFSALQKFTSQNPIYHKYSPSKVSHYNMRMCGSYTYTCMYSILGHGTCTCTYMNVTQLKKGSYSLNNVHNHVKLNVDTVILTNCKLPMSELTWVLRKLGCARSKFVYALIIIQQHQPVHNTTQGWCVALRSGGLKGAGPSTKKYWWRAKWNPPVCVKN